MTVELRYKQGDQIGGKYIVHSALAGGMSEVYLCLEKNNNRPFALKTLQAKYFNNSRFLESFKLEAGIWSSLGKHPNIVRCHYLDELDNIPFLFLEWVSSDQNKGTDLSSWIKQRPLSLRMALDILADLCRGLIYAQEKQAGIVHRDLKPGNILMGQSHTAKITDFGIAKIIEATGIKSNSFLKKDIFVSDGTPEYMAPEQWLRQELDYRTDIYALGCILFEMLTGDHLFGKIPRDKLREKHLHSSIPDFAVQLNLPFTVKRLLEGCLAKKKEDRFPSLQALYQEVVNFYISKYGEAPRELVANQDFSYADYSNRGATYLDLGMYQEALLDINKALEFTQSEALIYSNRGRVYMNLKEYEAARNDFEKALALEPDNANYHNNLANLYLELKDYDSALEYYNLAIELDPKLAYLYSNKARIYDHSGDYTSALVCLNRAVNLEPTDAKYLHDRSIIYSKLNQQENALSDCNKALTMRPYEAAFYSSRGLIYQKLQDYPLALQEFARALQLNSQDSITYYQRASLFNKLGRSTEAIADLNTAIELKPDHADAYLELSGAYYVLGNKKKAVEVLDTLISMKPDNSSAFHNRSCYYSDLQMFNEALRDANRALELEPDLLYTHNIRGCIFSELGDYESALMDFNRALEMNSEYAKAYSNRGIPFGNLIETMRLYQIIFRQFTLIRLMV